MFEKNLQLIIFSRPYFWNICKACKEGHFWKVERCRFNQLPVPSVKLPKPRQLKFQIIGNEKQINKSLLLIRRRVLPYPIQRPFSIFNNPTGRNKSQPTFFEQMTKFKVAHPTIKRHLSFSNFKNLRWICFHVKGIWVKDMHFKFSSLAK